jgi:pimeloyl-ACP methyl ester carboxylesterase
MNRAGLAVRTLAEGAPGAPLIVLAHGLEDRWTSWAGLAAKLNPDWRLVALDLPWRSGNDYRWRTRSSSDWLGDALDMVGASPDVLIAHSYAANAALNLLCDLDPRSIPAVLLICPLYNQPRHLVTWEMFDRARTAFAAHIQEGLRAQLGRRLHTMEPDVLQTMTDLALDRVGPSGFVTVFQQFTASSDLALEAVEVPTLVLAGGADPTLAPEAATALAARIPGAELQLHKHYDHFCHIRQVTGVAAHTTNFVTRTLTRTVGELR